MIRTLAGVVALGIAIAGFFQSPLSGTRTPTPRFRAHHQHARALDRLSGATPGQTLPHLRRPVLVAMNKHSLTDAPHHRAARDSPLPAVGDAVNFDTLLFQFAQWRWEVGAHETALPAPGTPR